MYISTSHEINYNDKKNPVMVLWNNCYMSKSELFQIAKN